MVRHLYFSRSRLSRGAQSPPRVKQHLSAFRFIEQVVRRFSLIKPDDPIDEAGLRAYFAEDVLPSG